MSEKAVTEQFSSGAIELSNIHVGGQKKGNKLLRKSLHTLKRNAEILKMLNSQYYNIFILIHNNYVIKCYICQCDIPQLL